MLEWLDNPEKLRVAITRLVAEAPCTDIAVAFWGAGALQRLGLDDSRSGHLRVVANLKSGGTNPRALCEVWEAVGADRVRQLNDLHAKVFVSDRCLIVGSANVSSNGLGAQDREVDCWREACIRTDDHGMITSARKWFAAQWAAASAIAPNDFTDAMEAWERSRRRRSISRTNQVSRQGLRDLSWETLEGRGIYVAISSQYMSARAAKTVEKAQKEDPTVDGYEDWRQMPVGATLLAFDVDFDKKADRFAVSWDGAWDTPPDKRARRARTVNNVTLVHRARPEDSLGITHANCAAWEQDIQMLCERFKASRTGLPSGDTWDDWCLPVEEAWWLLINPNTDEKLDSVTDAVLRDHILALTEAQRSFRTIDLIRLVVGRYYRDRERRGNDAANVRFAKRLSADRERLGIREIAADESVRDDAGGGSMTSRWERAA